MNNKVKKIVKTLNEELSKLVNGFSGCYVYGSQIRGDFSEDSDIDVVGIFEKIDDEVETKIYKIISLLNYKENVFIDIHPMTAEDLNRNYFFKNEVVNKGVYYERVA